MVTQTNDPMGILKVAFSGGKDSTVLVTQTNDPMGILKEMGRVWDVSGGCGYTDQRSDGDTERPTPAPGSLSPLPLHRPTIRWGY